MNRVTDRILSESGSLIISRQDWGPVKEWIWILDPDPLSFIFHFIFHEMLKGKLFHFLTVLSHVSN